MDKKKISITVLVIVFLLFAAIVSTWIQNSTQAEQRKREEIAQIFQPYQSYGLIYKEKENRLYYDGELVRYFEDREINHFFGPFEDSTIKIYTIRDKDGVLTGLDVDFNNDDTVCSKNSGR